MALKLTIIEVDDLDHLAPVLDVMRACTETGRGWINVQAEVDPDELQPPPPRKRSLQRLRQSRP